jgi:hypothetical protein
MKRVHRLLSACEIETNILFPPCVFFAVVHLLVPDTIETWEVPRGRSRTAQSSIHPQALTVQDGPLTSLSGFLDHTHTDTR